MSPGSHDSLVLHKLGSSDSPVTHKPERSRDFLNQKNLPGDAYSVQLFGRFLQISCQCYCIKSDSHSKSCLLPVVIGTVGTSVVDPKLFFSDPDPTFQEISDPDPAPDPISDPTQFISKEAIFFMLMHFGSARPYF